MSKVFVSGALQGQLQAMPSKSQAHRAVICAALCEGVSVISHIELSKDIAATLACVQELGLANYHVEGDAVTVFGKPKPVREFAELPCGESGSTLRFMIPLTSFFAEQAHFLCEGRLPERPLEPLKSLLAEKGVTWLDSHSISGRPRPGIYEIAGNVSSQFISGLLFLLPLLAEDSEIRLTTPLESAGYVEMTRDMLKEFGIGTEWRDESTLLVPGRQKYLPRDVAVEGDWSHAAVFAVAGVLGEGVSVSGLDADSLQGDKKIIDFLREMGAHIKEKDGEFAFLKSGLHGITMDVSQTPDLVPILAVAAAAADGRSEIMNAARLRLKESDRLAAIAGELAKMGAAVRQTEDGLIIDGGRPLAGANLDSHNDHRIAMAMAVAAGLAGETTVIERPGCVEKSAPRFWQEFRSLGGQAVEQ